ncbi:MAG: hypothetical protein ACOC6H_03190 [Thermoproteota archaeon]
MKIEKIVIIVLFALLVATNIGWFYMGYHQTDGSTTTNEFENKIQELRNKKTSIRLLYDHTFQEYRESYENQGYEFTEVNWATFKQKVNEYEERTGVKAVTIHPENQTFDVPGSNSTHYYHQIG